MALRDDIISNLNPKPQPAPNEAMADVATPSIAPIATRTPDIANVIPNTDQYAPTAMYKGGGAMENMYKAMFGDLAPESEADAAKREKRERRNADILALADGLSHIANIWGTTQGAPSMQLTSLSEVNRNRYEYAKQQRERNTDAWRRGILQARMQDINARQSAAENARKAAADERKWAYEMEKDRRKNEMDERKFRLDEKKNSEAAALNVLKHEEAVRTNKARENISRQNVAVARERNEIVRNKATGKEMKVARFGLSDGTNIQVPDDLKNDFYADVFGVLAEEVTKKGDKSDMSLLEFDQFGMLPKSSTMRDAVHALAKKYPAVEDFMNRKSQEYMDYYNNPPIPKGVSAPGAPTKTTIPGVNEKITWGSGSVYDPDDDFLM